MDREPKTIQQYFYNEKIALLLQAQLMQIPEASYSVTVEFQKIYIKILNFKSANEEHEEFGMDFKFVIKIGRNFPINGVRLYLLEGSIEPSLSDTRDLLKDCLGKQWMHKLKLVQIYQKLPQLVKRLKARNQNYLALQKTGSFHLQDRFFLKQLKKFTSLNVFSNQAVLIDQTCLTLIGVSETHFMIFKLDKKDGRRRRKTSVSSNDLIPSDQPFFISRVCDLQSISAIDYSRQAKELHITLSKFKNIKQFYQTQSVKKKFIFEDSEYFLRCVFKNISRFQTLRTVFIPYVDEQRNDELAQKLRKTHNLQQKLFGRYNVQTRQTSFGQVLSQADKKAILQQLQRNYQKLIQYYSARAFCYYLIYINKLQYLYKKYMIKKLQGQQSKTQKKPKN